MAAAMPRPQGAFFAFNTYILFGMENKLVFLLFALMPNDIQEITALIV